MELCSLKSSVQKFGYTIMVLLALVHGMIVEIRVHQIIPISEEEFGANSTIRSAVVNDPWVLLVLDSGRVVVYNMNPRTKDMDVHPQMANVEVTCFMSGLMIG